MVQAVEVVCSRVGWLVKIGEGGAAGLPSAGSIGVPVWSEQQGRQFCAGPSSRDHEGQSMLELGTDAHTMACQRPLLRRKIQLRASEADEGVCDQGVDRPHVSLESAGEKEGVDPEHHRKTPIKDCNGHLSSPSHLH